MMEGMSTPRLSCIRLTAPMQPSEVFEAKKRPQTCTGRGGAAGGCCWARGALTGAFSCALAGGRPRGQPATLALQAGGPAAPGWEPVLPPLHVLTSVVEDAANNTDASCNGACSRNRICIGEKGERQGQGVWAAFGGGGRGGGQGGRHWPAASAG